MHHISHQTSREATFHLSAKERQQAQSKAIEQQLFLEARKRQIERDKQKRPIDYKRPAFNTPQYWRDSARGWISEDQQCQNQVDFQTRRKRALDSKHNKASSPHRHQRMAPRPTKQFSKPMSTQAARDDRLTPQAKALLQVIVARTGKGRYTDTTKTTLGIIMNRWPRSIQRYVQELIKFGYIRTQTRKSKKTGFFIGLRIWIMNRVLPFFAQKNSSDDADQGLDLPGTPRNREETKMSLTNHINIFKREKPAWLTEYVLQ